MTTSYIYYILVITVRFTEKLKNLAYLTPLYDWFGKRSFAQSGEDVIAWGELKNSRTEMPAGPGLADWGPLRPGPPGFYVDVGAYHPKLFSNTYLFYKKGWRGICIEPNPKMGKLFRITRPRDVFLNVGVGAGEGVTVSQCHGGVRFTRKGYPGEPRFGIPKLAMTNKKAPQVTEMEYFIFEDGAVNTFSAEQARKNQEEAGRKLVGKRKIHVLSLKTILDKYLPKVQKIDLLSVDAEGMDLEVLRSNDWKKYRPEIIIAEDLSFDFEKPKKSKIVRFLLGVGYRLVAKTPYSLIFKLNERSRTN